MAKWDHEDLKETIAMIDMKHKMAMYGSDNTNNYIQLLHMIASRLRVPEGSTLPFEHIHAFKISENRAGVVVVHNETAALLEDEWALFPSDALITKLRLLAK